MFVLIPILLSLSLSFLSLYIIYLFHHHIFFVFVRQCSILVSFSFIFVHLTLFVLPNLVPVYRRGQVEAVPPDGRGRDPGVHRPLPEPRPGDQLHLQGHRVQRVRDIPAHSYAGGGTEHRGIRRLCKKDRHQGSKGIQLYLWFPS